MIGVIGIIAVLVALNFFPQETDVVKTSVEITAYYVDMDGNVIPLNPNHEGPLPTFSTVTFPGFDPVTTDTIFLGIAITASNEFDTDKPIQITSITGSNSPGISVLPSALSGLSHPLINPGDTETQYTEPMDITSLELGDVTFTIDIEGYFIDAFGNQVTVSVQDNIIVSIIEEGFVNFRTNDLAYGGEIAHISLCGSDLERYSYATGGYYSNRNCADDMPSGNTYCPGPNTLLLENLPGELSGMAGGENPSLWLTDAGYLCVCDDKGYAWRTHRFTSGGSSVSVDTLWSNSLEELRCTEGCVGTWVDGECNAGGCTNQRQQIKTYVPSLCAPTEYQCVDDDECIPQVCGDGEITGSETCDIGEDMTEGTPDDVFYQDRDCTYYEGAGATGQLLCDNCQAEVPDDCTPAGGGAGIVVFRTGIMGCTEDWWDNRDIGWIAVDNDETYGNDLEGLGNTGDQVTTRSPSMSFLTAPCDYGISYYGAGRVYIINAWGTYDAEYEDGTTWFHEGSDVLSEQPCCGTTCGICCERYGDGTSYCSPYTPVKFRTDVLDATQQNPHPAIAYTLNCGGGDFLIGSNYATAMQRQESGTCDTSGYTTDYYFGGLPFDNIAGGDGNWKFYNYYIGGGAYSLICLDDLDGNGYYYRRFAEDTNPQIEDLTPLPSNPTYEVSC